MLEKISAFIITKNEATRIAKAINSIKNIVDEIIVVDSGSTDDTVNIASNLGAQVYYNEWPGYAKQKAYAESLCKHKWILNIDADEELSNNLANEIAYIFTTNNQDKYQGYNINFVIMHRLDTKTRFLAPSNKFIRLYDKNYLSYTNITNYSTRDAVMFKNDKINKADVIYDLHNPAYHYSGISIEQLVNKANFYSSQQANDMIQNNRIPSKLRVSFEFITCFFKAFFIRRYFVFGYAGFVDSMIFAFARFLRMAKTRESYEQQKELKKIELN